MKYEERRYRGLIHQKQRSFFKVTVQETDLLVHADRRLAAMAKESIFRHRSRIESYIDSHPDFLTTLVPWAVQPPAPKIIMDMAEAGQKAAVGPMAAVAGAIAEYVGRDLLAQSGEVMVENGGDLFIKMNEPLTVAVFAGKSPLSMKIGLRIDPNGKPMGVCTSSGTIGHSHSMGRADAVCAVADTAALADAAATAIGNQVDGAKSINAAIDFGREIPGILGILIVIGDKLGLWGDLGDDMTLVPLSVKKG